MRKRVLAYLKYTDSLIKMYQDNPEEVSQSLDQAIKDHLIQIGFFAHERLIHLIVTVTFAILCLMSMAMTVINFSISSFLLTIIFLIMMIPYIRHYYLLENSVQRMYEQYDSMKILKDHSSFSMQNPYQS